MSSTTPGNTSSGSPLGTSKSVKLNFGTKTPGNGKSKEKMDRFIPTRSAMDFDSANFSLSKENKLGEQGSPSKEESYQKALAASLSVNDSSRILAFKQKAPAAPEGYENSLKSLYNQNLAPTVKKTFRHVPTTQERILDAPELMDDYYLNLLDWSGQNLIAVALGRSVYLWNAASGGVEELCTVPNEGDYISALKWGSDGNFLAVGTSDAKVQIWDANRRKQVRELCGHTNRVSALSWNGAVLSSGSRDSTIANWDVRKRRDEACVARLTVHEQEVCGLEWSLCGQQLASGGNDNVLAIHDASFRLCHKVQAHSAAVKALAWCPYQSNLLATGGGTADRHIRFWNTHTCAMLSAIDTGSQVCALQWNPHARELLSSHGYSKNQLCLWKYPSLEKVAELTGHTGRVLHMATSPDGCSVVTAGADETLRFWRPFGEPPSAKDGDSKLGGGGGAMMGAAVGAAGGAGGFGGLRSIR
ncbi:hypothetical protein HXX76_011844 [Chlamydomonas incerta]|uniref:CDC20/Fizzy WD40 domain-containing protein n=1 Tax=Chlamydomonas incerta TaxID=51695 RepID=A0A835STT9_CHLIN|nr:hypothetical protein HXX76_011844 [Chlamydomonas incerta]|eukprot:KAG2428164.1 hypothetical protein HXX76_011844 [Chlamydomonas incerta]